MVKCIGLVLGVTISAGCAATVGTGGVFYVPKDAAGTCAAHCNEIGLTLGSVVIMANNVGRVCSAAPAASASGEAGGGIAALIMQEQAQRSNLAQVQQSQPR